jgi:hypothetical protein
VCRLSRRYAVSIAFLEVGALKNSTPCTFHPTGAVGPAHSAITTTHRPEATATFCLWKRLGRQSPVRTNLKHARPR